MDLAILRDDCCNVRFPHDVDLVGHGFGAEATQNDTHTWLEAPLMHVGTACDHFGLRRAVHLLDRWGQHDVADVCGYGGALDKDTTTERGPLFDVESHAPSIAFKRPISIKRFASNEFMVSTP